MSLAYGFLGATLDHNVAAPKLPTLELLESRSEIRAMIKAHSDEASVVALLLPFVTGIGRDILPDKLCAVRLAETLTAGFLKDCTWACEMDAFNDNSRFLRRNEATERSYSGSLGVRAGVDMVASCESNQIVNGVDETLYVHTVEFFVVVQSCNFDVADGI